MNTSILVVEDNPDNLKLLAWALQDAGYEFAAVDSAEKALALLEEEVFDLVLMDILLPGMNGKEAARRLRRDPRFASLPIIAVTAHATKEEEQRIRDCGFTAIRTKPIDEADLLQTIQAILRPAPEHDWIASSPEDKPWPRS